MTDRNRMESRIFRITAGLFLILFLLCAFLGCGQEHPRLVEISEVVSSNDESFVDDVYGTSDWIELHNAGDTPVSLNGWYLMDKLDSPKTECCLPNIVLQPDEYCILFADKEGVENGSRCLPFGIDKDGEDLYLFDAGGNLVFSLEIPALDRDVSWAKAENGSYGYCLYPTPARANSTDILSELPVIPSDKDEEKAQPSMQRSEVRIRINEISTVASEQEPDWIELFNDSSEDISVEGFFLSDSAQNPQKAILPGWIVPANGYLVVPLGAELDPETGINAFSLSSKGEELFLYDSAFALIDTVCIPALPEGLVYARRTDKSFGYCGDPTPGRENSEQIFTEPIRTMRGDAPIHINEALFRNRFSAIDAYGDHSDWIELVNRGDSAVSLSGYYLSDIRSDLKKWALPDLSLEPGAYLLVFLSGKASTEQELHASFSVSQPGEGCLLYCASTLEVEWIPYPEDLKENVSLGLDETGSLVFFAYPTPGYPNAQSFPDQEACGIAVGDVFISEVCAADEDGDWIELYNRGSDPKALTGWHLSNDSSQMQKLSLDPFTILPGEYCVISLKNEKGESSPFSVSMSGEKLILSDDRGAVVDFFESGALRYGKTSGRREDDTAFSRVFFLHPSKGARNDTDFFDGYEPSPIFSDTTLYHERPFLLSLHTDDPSAVIHYTADGSAPSENSPVYSEPIPIEHNTAVRAIAVSEGRFVSDESVANYLFVTPHTIPVVCIAAEPGKWKDLTQVPFKEAGLKEQAVRMAFYETDGTLGTVFPAGISPRGNASLSYPQKSLSVHLRSEYGQNAVTYPFWGKGSFLSYRFLVLRNGSQDIDGARMRDSFANRAAQNLRFFAAKTRPVIVYVNGEYYGIMDLNEGMNQSYFWTHFRKESSEVNLVQRNSYVKHGSADGFVALREYAARYSLADPERMKAFCERADVDAITDYIIAQSFFGNYDIHNQNWVSTNDGSIRWQPYLYDVDRCLNRESFSSNVLYMYFNSQGVVHDRQGDRIMMEIPCGLKKNKDWCDAFVNRYAELLCTDFSEQRLLSLLDEMADRLRPEMEQHIAKWKLPDSVSTWENSVLSFRRYISMRYDYIEKNIKKLFHVSDEAWDALIAQYSAASR